jgi:hypothetical protein
MSGLPAKKVRDAQLSAYRKPFSCVNDLIFYGDTVYRSSARVGFTRLAIHALLNTTLSLQHNGALSLSRCNAPLLMYCIFLQAVDGEAGSAEHKIRITLTTSKSVANLEKASAFVENPDARGRLTPGLLRASPFSTV